jgi:hypothetical protein
MQVFLSYGQADRAVAQELGERLAAAGLEVWDPGENVPSKTGEALEKSQAMVVLLSPRSSQSLSIRRELEYALGAPNFKGRLVPLVTRRGTKIPWILKTLPVVGPQRDLAVATRQIVKLLGTSAKIRRPRRRVAKTRRHAPSAAASAS